MTCRKCKFEFCWTCGFAMTHTTRGMSDHQCNKYFDENKEKKIEKSRTQLKVISMTISMIIDNVRNLDPFIGCLSLQKFLHYCNRYLNHSQSLKLENKLYEAVADKMQELQETHHMSWIEVQFLQRAVDALTTCRLTLMYTYCFAYYLTTNNQQLIFEDNQQDLENATEILSRYLERDLSEEDATDIKKKVVDQTKYCESRRIALVQHVKEGHDKDWWVYES